MNAYSNCVGRMSIIFGQKLLFFRRHAGSRFRGDNLENQGFCYQQTINKWLLTNLSKSGNGDIFPHNVEKYALHILAQQLQTSTIFGEP